MEIIDGKDLAGMKFQKLEDGTLKVYDEKGKFIPKDGEGYYYIDAFNCIDYAENENSDADKYLFYNNLVFRKEEEAADYKDFLDTLSKYKTKFKDKYEIEYICYDCRSDNIFVVKSCNSLSKMGCLYFDEGNALKFINAVGEESIKKYMFDIWE